MKNADAESRENSSCTMTYFATISRLTMHNDDYIGHNSHDTKFIKDVIIPQTGADKPDFVGRLQFYRRP